MKIKEIKCKSILSKSRLYSVDYSINPYIGCQHGCVYCYAVFMRKYTNHKEPWGEFVDVKVNAPEKLKEDLIKAKEGLILLSSVTDPYQPIEEKYKLTRKILKILSKTNFPVSILTKSDLVLHDLDILKQFSSEKISVGFTINFLDDRDRKNWEPLASSIESRLEALEKFYLEGIPTYIHVGPWFEGIANLEKIFERVEDYISEFQIENLNFRQKEKITRVIQENYPELKEKYSEICRNSSSYKERLKDKVKNLHEKSKIPISLFID